MRANGGPRTGTRSGEKPRCPSVPQRYSGWVTRCHLSFWHEICDQIAHREVLNMKTELDKFYGLIEKIKVAMMTTRRPDGHLESRAMANQKQADGADLWFVTTEGAAIVLFELATGWITGAPVEPGETHTLTEPHR